MALRSLGELRARLRAGGRRLNDGFGPRLLLSLLVSLALVGVAATPVIESSIRSAAREEGLRLTQSDAAGIADGVRGAEKGDDLLAEATDLLLAIDARPRVIDVRLIGPDRRTIASPRPSELGEVESEGSVEEALRLGRSFAGFEDEAGDRPDDLAYVVPVDLPSGRHALELDEDGAYVEAQVSAARGFVVKGMLCALVGAVVLFYLLGGRRLGRLHRLAVERSMRDGLTDLGNQRAFRDELGGAVALASRHGAPLSLIALDLDDFKLANDQHGHAHGDTLLKRVAEVLGGGRAYDRAFRLGGDEFAAILPRTDTTGALRVAARFRRELAAAGGIVASVGVAELLPGEGDPDVLHREADAAAYQVKSEGGDAALAFSDLRVADDAVRPMKVGRLSELLEQGDLPMVFQPIWDLDEPRPIGYEALARPAERHGFSGPAEAFSTAERFRLVPQLDALCQRRAFEEARALPEDALLFVNVTRRSLERESRIDETLSALAREHGFDPTRVVIEITERAVTNAATLIGAARRLKAAGFQVALDDVGAGNSGLEALRSTVFDFVKVDRSIVGAALSDTAARAVLFALDAFVAETGAFLIAEGVEDEEMLDFVRRLDGHRDPPRGSRRGVQGFVLGRPEPAAAHRGGPPALTVPRR